MIGVITSLSDRAVVREFFELFKTPWEFYQISGRYDTLLCCGEGEVPENNARLTIIYAGRRTSFDAQQNIRIASDRNDAGLFSLSGIRIPIYGENITFCSGSSDSAMFLQRAGGKTIVRIGYHLFGEVRTLLTTGQPATNAGIPALDLHICMLRDVIVTSGIRLIEIPPVPDGYRFLGCLTHDIDHPLLRQHKLDHTMFGFLYRATLGSLVQLLRDRLPMRDLLRNWVAALKLPFVHLGLAKDLWYQFDRYTDLEKGASSTFFVIPFEDRAGRNAPGRRAAGYGAARISNKLRALTSAGCEIGLHGIDAWLDAAEGCAESEEVRRITGQREMGARMHWLYFDDHSPVSLEQAGIVYDSTVGYNETIGYRAGTTQVYKPLQTSRLLEVPLHIMDTALFYPGYLDLSPKEARERVGAIIDSAVELGGCVTVNWHDRSIAPERQWGHFYAQLIEALESRGARLSTAAQTAAWFRMRRSAVFENVTWESNKVRATIAVTECADLPGLQLRVHQTEESRRDVPINRKVTQGSSPDCHRKYTLDVSLTPAYSTELQL
jgi:hypothetical protein